jgi:hypothetical protein
MENKSKRLRGGAADVEMQSRAAPAAAAMPALADAVTRSKMVSTVAGDAAANADPDNTASPDAAALAKVDGARVSGADRLSVADVITKQVDEAMPDDIPEPAQDVVDSAKASDDLMAVDGADDEFVAADDGVEPAATIDVPVVADAAASVQAAPAPAPAAATAKLDLPKTIQVDIGTDMLTKLVQNISQNILLNAAAADNVLGKLVQIAPTDQTAGLASSKASLGELTSKASDFLRISQTALKIPLEDQVQPEQVLERAAQGTPQGDELAGKLLGAEAAAILGSMTAATVFMLGGAGRRRHSRRRRGSGRHHGGSHGKAHKSRKHTARRRPK